MNSLIASASRIGTVPPLAICVTSMVTVVVEEIKKSKVYKRKYGTEEKYDDRHYMWVSQCSLGGEASTQVPHRSVAFHLWLILSRNLVAALAVRLSTSNQLVNDKEQLYHNYGPVFTVLFDWFFTRS